MFLRNLSATVIPSLAMPMSIAGTFAVMYLLDYSLDNLSLMALTLSVGFVVDDAIVMLENIVRHMEMGKAPLEAAHDGAKEIGFTIVSMTLSLAAVFIPVLFMGGIVGRLFREFAVVIGLAVLISGFVSLTLTPMLASRFLRPPGEVAHRRLYELSERGFAGMLRAYEAGLRWSLGHRRTMMGVTAAVTILTGILFVLIPKGFIPSQDIGMLFGSTETAEGMSFDAMVRHQKAVAAVVEADPDVEVFTSSAGGRGGSLNTGRLWLRLKPRGERSASADEVVDRLRPKIAAIPGIKAYIQSPPAIQVGGRRSSSQYQLTLQGPDTDELYRAAPLLEARLRALPGLTDVATDLYLKNPEVNLKIDRDKAAAVGVTPAQIENALYSAYGQRQVSSIYAPNNEYQVLMELQPEYQNEPADLGLLYVHARGGQLVPLASLVKPVTGVGPLTVNHSGQAPSVTLSFNLRPGAALGPAVAQVEKLARATLPASISTSFQGTAQAFQASMQGLGILLALAVLVIYMVLGILYESFIHPLTILSALPLAGAGAIATLMIFGSDLNIYAYVGIIMLVGLVKKNGIMMIDFALEAQRTEGKSPADAIFEACVVRFRPIMMTTMAALFGTLPIALGFGAGAEARRPLGLAVVGGLLVSQSLTLFVTPVFFTYMEGLQRRLRRTFTFGLKRMRPAAEGAPAAT
jgi:HAE1 family hydrophobic/amphiphilic exporter-1